MFNRKKISTKTMINLETIVNPVKNQKRSFTELTEEEEETTKTQKRMKKIGERSAESSSFRSTTFIKVERGDQPPKKFDIFNYKSDRGQFPSSARYTKLVKMYKEKSNNIGKLEKKNSKEIFKRKKAPPPHKNEKEDKNTKKGKVDFLLSYGNRDSKSLKGGNKLYLKSPKFKHKKTLKKILSGDKQDLLVGSRPAGMNSVKIKKKLQNKYLSLRDDTVGSPKFRNLGAGTLDWRMSSGKKTSSVQKSRVYRQRSKEISKLDLLFKYPDIEGNIQPKLHKSKKSIIKMRVDHNKRVLDMLNRRSGKPPNRANFGFRATAKHSSDVYQTSRISRKKRSRPNSKSKTKHDFIKREVFMGLYEDTGRNLSLTYKSLQRNIKKHQGSNLRIFNPSKIRQKQKKFKTSLSCGRNKGKLKKRQKIKKDSHRKIKLDRNIEYEYKVYNPPTPRYSFDTKENRGSKKQQKIPLSLLKGKLIKKEPLSKVIIPVSPIDDQKIEKLKKEKKVSLAKRKKSFTVFDDINIDPSGFGAWKTGPDTLPEYLIENF